MPETLVLILSLPTPFNPRTNEQLSYYCSSSRNVKFPARFVLEVLLGTMENKTMAMAAL